MSMQISTTRSEHPVDDARLAEILANPGFGIHFTDHMFTVEWTPDDGLARRPDRALRPAHPRPGHRRPALRAGDLRGHEGLPARGRLDLGVPARGERRPDGALQPPARAAGARGRRLRRRPSTRWSPSTSAGCPERRAQGEKSLYVRPFMFASEAFLGVRPAQHVTFMVIASPAGVLLQGRHQAGHALAVRGVHPRRPRRHGRGQDRRQLRQLAAAAAGGDRAGLRPGGLPRRRGGDVRRGARRHEPVLRLHRTAGSSPRRSARSSRASPAARSSSSPARWATRSRSAGSRSTSGARASTSGDIIEIFACGTAAVVTPVGELKWDGGSAPGARVDRPDHAGSGRRWSTSSSAGPRTPSAGCTGSSDGRPPV